MAQTIDARTPVAVAPPEKITPDRSRTTTRHVFWSGFEEAYGSGGISGIDSNGRPYGELGTGDPDQLMADRKYWPLADAKKGRLKAIVYVVDGRVERIRKVDPNGTWIRDSDPQTTGISQ